MYSSKGNEILHYYVILLKVDYSLLMVKKFVNGHWLTDERRGYAQN